MDPEVIPARMALRMATLGGAQAIGLGDQIGALTVGRRADMIQVSLDDVHFLPLYNVISHLAYVAHERDVVTVIVDGKILMSEGRIRGIDQKRTRSEATAIAARIRAAVIDK
jgi:5-methylthioadenosine/S-adenosylhomocysteine deaminase